MTQAVSPLSITAGDSGSIPGYSMCDLWWTKWHRDRVFSEYIGFPVSISFHKCLILIFIYTLLLPEGQTGETEVPPWMECSFGNGGALPRRELSLFYLVLKAVARLRRLVAVISPRIPGFNSRSVCLRLVMEKVEKILSPNTSIFACLYHSTNAPHSSSSTHCYHQKYKRAKPGNLPRSNALSEIGEQGMGKHFSLFL
jgi:hypothetical protein